MLGFKYQNHRAVATLFAERLLVRLRTIPEVGRIEVVTWVPTTRERRMARGHDPLGTGAGALDDRLAREVRAADRIGGVAEIERLAEKALATIPAELRRHVANVVLRVEDFCDAVATVAHRGMWGEDWNVAAETPETTGKIVELMSAIACKDLTGVVQWYPGTDYLGNHRLSSQKFRDASGWTPKHSLCGGLEKSWDDIQRNLGSTEYNPLRYLEDAKNRGLDLTQFFNQ